jgi:anti-sigma factor RsiW
MSPSHDPMTCQELESRIEALVDGDLGKPEAESLGLHIARCPGCSRRYQLAVDIRRELRELPELETPAHILEAVLERSRRRSSRRRAWNALWQTPRPVRVALAVAAALGALAIFLPRQMPPSQPAPSAELIHATEEARLALAYLDKVTERTAQNIHHDVFQRHVVLPAARSLSRSLALDEADTAKDSPPSDYRSSDEPTRSS